MNIHSPAEVIETMCLLTHDANDVSIEVEYETIIVKAQKVNSFSMRWSYEGYGNERVRQIAKEYHLVLMKAQREENKPY
jgi:hypothetical protein